MRKSALLPLAWSVAVAVTSACTETNASITSSVNLKLSTDPAIDAREIKVSTQKGVVVLTGRTNTQEAKERAIALARQTKGVVSVTDMLEVRDSGTNAAGAAGASPTSPTPSSPPVPN